MAHLMADMTPGFNVEALIGYMQARGRLFFSV